MKKILLFLGVLWVPFCAYGVPTVTSPSLDLGTITYTTSPFRTYTFSVTDHSQGTVTASSDTGEWDENYTYTPFNMTAMDNHSDSVHIELSQAQGNEIYGPNNCGKISVTNMTLNADHSTSSPDARDIPKQNRNRFRSPFTNGFYIVFTATVTPYSFTGTCDIGGTVNTLHWVDASDEGSVDISVSVHLEASEGLAHDDNAALNFGTFCSSADQPQSLTVTPSGTIGASTAVCPVSGVSADSFTFTSYSATSFTVTLPTSTTLHGPDPSGLEVNSFTSSCNTCTVTNGTGNFTVGGTISVPVGTTPGDYEGTYQVSVTY